MQAHGRGAVGGRVGIEDDEIARVDHQVGPGDVVQVIHEPLSVGVAHAAPVRNVRVGELNDAHEAIFVPSDVVC